MGELVFGPFLEADDGSFVATALVNGTGYVYRVQRTRAGWSTSRWVAHDESTREVIGDGWYSRMYATGKAREDARALAETPAVGARP